jgi:uncharacterized membrane protein YdfJ with MMPL/SSD domain
LRWCQHWIAAAAYDGFAVPTPRQNSANVVNLVPSGAPAERLTRLEAKQFRVPLDADTAVVQFHASGLSAAAQASWSRFTMVTRPGV